MEAHNPVEKGTDEALDLLARKQSELLFNDVLAFASEVCLKKPPEYLTLNDTIDESQYSPDQRIARRLGARVFKAVVERTKLGTAEYTPQAQENYAALFSQPGLFTDHTNYRVLVNAERFGQALINESLASLGPDVYALAERMQAAATEYEQIAILEIVAKRIERFRQNNHTSDEHTEENQFYPPYRLSPKIFGSYPKPDLTASCLAASTMAAAFFERAGIPYLHAGVNTPASDFPLESLRNGLMIAGYDRHLRKEPLLQPRHQDAVEGLASNQWAYAIRPTGRHGAIYAKLKQSCVQFDPYMNSFAVLDDPELDGWFDERYTEITEMREYLPHYETSRGIFSSVAEQDLYSRFGVINFFLQAYEPTNDTRQRIDDILRTIPDESAFEHVATQSAEALYDQTNIDTLDSKEHLAAHRALAEIRSIESLAADLKDGNEIAFGKYVLWEDSFETFVARCQTDAAYRARRVEDIIALPVMTGLTLTKNEAEYPQYLYPHVSVDLGSPAMRIGLATLSDFAHYDGDKLPASFWLTHWPGTTALINAVEAPVSDAEDIATVYNNASLYSGNKFTLSVNDGTVMSFLSTHAPKE